MTTPAYISTLGSIIEAKKSERTKIAQLTKQYLSQGCKITVISGPVVRDIVSHTGPSSQYNKKSASANKKKRDVHVEDIVRLLGLGTMKKDICKELEITHHVLQRIIQENNLEP